MNEIENIKPKKIKNLKNERKRTYSFNQKW